MTSFLLAEATPGVVVSFLLTIGESGDWELLLLLLATYLGTSMWLIAIFDVMRSSFPKNEKFFWQQLIAYLPLLGAVVYLLIGQHRKLG